MDSNLTGKYRLGTVAFVNALPIAAKSCLPATLSDSYIKMDTPANLLLDLENETLDAALVSSVALAYHRDWFGLDGPCIASNGPVGSVGLFYRRSPWRKGAKVLVDNRSRSSQILLSLLLKLGVAHDIELTEMDNADTVFMSDPSWDGVLLIGDLAWRWYRSGKFNYWDLAQAWRTWTGFPFVFALWVLPKRNPDLEQELISWGKQSLSNWHKTIVDVQDISHPDVYIRDYLLHWMGAKERRGLNVFLDMVQNNKTHVILQG